MKIQSIKISGFKSIPFNADYVNIDNHIEVNWNQVAFQINIPFRKPFISAIIGPNSCGKSSVLYALQYFFSTTTSIKNPENYYFKNINQPIIIEITFRGRIIAPDEWHFAHCIQEGDEFQLTLLSISNVEGRVNYIREPNGILRKQTTPDKEKISLLMPKFRLIPADSKLIEEVNPEKKNLVTDLIEEIVTISSIHSNRSIQYKIQKKLDELNQLVLRNEDTAAKWKDIEKLENSIASGLMELASGKPNVRFNINEAIPSMQTLFTKGKFSVVDGVEIGFEGQGLGIQRTFLISVLNTWVSTIGQNNQNQNYFFAIEEPELFLHPHAIRSLLNILENISKRDQVLFSSHVGEFVNSVPIDNVIKIQREGNIRNVVQPKLDSLTIKEKTGIQRYMLENKSDMLFARAVLLVEGQTEYFALPSFAKKIGLDLNKKGISIVFTNGNSNFSTYHNILDSFNIPHIILSDGDGQKNKIEERLNGLANEVIVLPEDFEYLIASSTSDERLLTLINQCRKMQGTKPLQDLQITGITEEQLVGSWYGKLIEDIQSDIATEHRNNLQAQQNALREIICQMAQIAIANNFLLPTAEIKKRASLIKKQTKPLAGRVIGELLTIEEIKNLHDINQALLHVIDLTN